MKSKEFLESLGDTAVIFQAKASASQPLVDATPSIPTDIPKKRDQPQIPNPIPDRRPLPQPIEIEPAKPAETPIITPREPVPVG